MITLCGYYTCAIYYKAYHILHTLPLGAATTAYSSDFSSIDLSVERISHGVSAMAGCSDDYVTSREYTGGYDCTHLTELLP